MRLLSRMFVIYVVAALMLGFAVVALRDTPAHGTGPPAPTSSNAGWLDHHWVNTAPTQTEVRTLCTTLQAHHIGTVYVHVGPADASGNIVAGRAPFAARFVHALHVTCRGVQALAWIGQLLPVWDGMVNLHTPAVREGLVRTAAYFISLGFDGIQYDLEPVQSGDTAFIALLRATRRALPVVWLAVASPAIMPDGGLPALAHLRLPLVPWSSAYYKDVAGVVDEIDPMLYATGLRDTASYSTFVATEARTLTATLASTTLKLGLPAYAGRSAIFDDRVENLASSLRGLPRVSGGAQTAIAIYPLWNMTPAAWTAFDRWFAT